ncbi:MAG: hypothetical protein CVV64_02315 [Candidatus Wallbacteria bacterium HGW-Wallbacteria-1]|jgi:NAD(P)H-hydrate epimerase|uniref:Bifunctional NAD(P)H-hydrate repair enzyme n=1 Tax=Candidatus Wallbacteria bacterium HGW-Wallbacteria-1 TaxID=2013854 RepID=A0A2N1PVC7_9BACT|nr:MAG: hypothetical protein CVV64_02315 [Candidatus Wallbacteria bacterium HGW-Wallbacteria-1]
MCFDSSVLSEFSGIYDSMGMWRGFPLLDYEGSRKADSMAVHKGGIPSLVLMESAARSLAMVVSQMLFQGSGKGVVIACGRGNNGGDGFALARTLLNRGIRAMAFLFGDETTLSPECEKNLELLKMAGGSVEVIRHENDSHALQIFARSCAGAFIIVDALLGTGFSGTPRGVVASAIEIVNASGGRVLSVDVPSGLAGGCLEPDLCIRAHRTLSLGSGKTELFLWPGRQWAGRVQIAEIGIPEKYISECARAYAVSINEVAAALPPRHRNSHKGDFGRVMILAGSPGMRGAGQLTVLGALRSGAGLVTLASDAAAGNTLFSAIPEVMTASISQWSGANDLVRHLTADAVAAGPGLGLGADQAGLVTDLVEYFPGVLVLDADALSLLSNSEGIDVMRRRESSLILTPHPGEFGRLLSAFGDNSSGTSDPIGSAQRFADCIGVTVLLKGAVSVIASPECTPMLIDRGSHGMAKGGSGDLLTGIVVSLAAQGMAGHDAAWCGAWIAGRAGELAAMEYNGRTCLPSDVALFAGRVFNEIDQCRDSLEGRAAGGYAMPFPGER